jgi:F420-non-reducing hydrogenase large subunit
MPKIILQPISRIEGHAKVIIQLDQAGEVGDARVVIPSLRGFEKFVIGRPIEEIPRIVTRICGVCPWAHHLAASKACDAIAGVDIPAPAKKLRELALVCHFIHSHILQLFILSGPDLLYTGEGAVTPKGLLGLLDRFPDIIHKALQARKTGQMMTAILGGRGIHPDVSVPGGWSKPLAPDELVILRRMGYECLDFARFAIDYAKQRILPALLQDDDVSEATPTGFLGTVKDGALSLYDGTLRMMAVDGTFQEFAGPDYRQYIEEHDTPGSYGRTVLAKPAGAALTGDPTPPGIYRANALARINLCDRIETPEAQAEMELFRRNFGRPAQNTALFHWARLIETLYATERAIELLDDPEIGEPFTAAHVEPGAGRGVGVVEAPRGTLIHDYSTDNRGFITAANIIVGTTHNVAAMNLAVRRVAQANISEGKCGPRLLTEIGRAVRVYDP